jgi:acetylornithine aminotransferase
MAQEQLVENAATVGAYLLDELKPVAALRKVKMVRGQGMVLAIEFKLPIAPKVAYSCYRKGLLIEFSDAHTLFISPPLALTRAQAKAGADIIKQACGLT